MPAEGCEAIGQFADGKAAMTLAIDDRVLAGSTLLGLSMFTILFLGAVLAVFLTLGAVRGDAERGLLQPLVVRPVGRTSLLLGRFAGAAAVCALYVALVYGAAVLITGIAGDWWPDRAIGPGTSQPEPGDRPGPLPAAHPSPW